MEQCKPIESDAVMVKYFLPISRIQSLVGQCGILNDTVAKWLKNSTGPGGKN